MLILLDFVQVSLILRSQVGLTHCAMFILWSEVRSLASVLDIFILTLFLTSFCCEDRFRQKLRSMDFDTFLCVQYEHHSLVRFFVLVSFDVFQSEVVTPPPFFG